MPAPHRSYFTGQMLLLMPNQHCQNTEGKLHGITHTHTHTHTHTQPFYGLFSGTTRVNRCQKKSSSGLYGAREAVMLVYCGQMVGQIKMKLGVQVGLSPGHIVLDGDLAPHPQKVGTVFPNFRPMSIAAKWLDESRCHLVWRQGHNHIFKVGESNSLV